MLHWLSIKKKIKEVVDKSNIDEDLVDLILQLAQFEFDLKALFRKLIEEKDKTWNADKKECDFYMEETAAFFAG